MEVGTRTLAISIDDYFKLSLFNERLLQWVREASATLDAYEGQIAPKEGSD